MVGRMIGVSAARAAACKRGLATNLAAAFAHDDGTRVCVVDADPAEADVGTRVSVSRPTAIQLADLLLGEGPAMLGAAVARLRWPALAVVPAARADKPGAIQRALAVLTPWLLDSFDIVVVELPVGAGRPGPMLDSGLLRRFDVLIVATTPDAAGFAATQRHLRLVEESVERGHLTPNLVVRVAVTGDEACGLPADVALPEALEARTAGRVPQFWGRAAPNRGFGLTTGVAELDDALGELARACLEAAPADEPPRDVA